jgi:hypothetical protein
VLLQQAMCVVRSEESLQATCVSSGSLPRITPNPTSVTELLYTLLSCLFALAMYTLSMLYMCVCVIYLGIRRACDFTTKNPAPPAEEQIGEKRSLDDLAKLIHGQPARYLTPLLQTCVSV